MPASVRWPSSRPSLSLLAARALGALVLFTLLFVSRAALAQSITVVNEASLPRLDKDGNVVSKRPLTLTPEAVSLQDCVDDQQIRFTLQLAGYTVNDYIEVWGSNSGADCKVTTARSGGVQVCWSLLSRINPQPIVNADIPVRKILSGAPPFSASAANDKAEACGKVNLSTITVHLLYFGAGDSATAKLDKSVAVTVDTVGPDPPTGLRIKPGNTRLQVEWNSISGGSADSGATGGLTDLTGIKVYCDLVGATTTTTANAPVCHDEVQDAGIDDSGDAATTTVQVCEDGGSTTSTSSEECASSNFVVNGEPVLPTTDFNTKYECGSFTGNTGTSVTATSVNNGPLVNGTRYAVAVAATDKFGNVGKLSSVVCETPEVTTDFWDDYKKAGGAAGGGCASNGESGPLGSMSVLALAVTSIAVTWRRRRKQAQSIDRK